MLGCSSPLMPGAERVGMCVTRSGQQSGGTALPKWPVRQRETRQPAQNLLRLPSGHNTPHTARCESQFALPSFRPLASSRRMRTLPPPGKPWSDKLGLALKLNPDRSVRLNPGLIFLSVRQNGKRTCFVSLVAQKWLWLAWLPG